MPYLWKTMVDRKGWMTNLIEILRKFANEKEWVYESCEHIPNLVSVNGTGNGGFGAATPIAAGYACHHHNRLVAKNRAVVSELEKLTSKIREAGFDWAGASRISRAQIYESDLDRIAAKLAAALEDAK